MTLESTKGIPMMLDRADAEAVIFRAALVAFTWYPDKHRDEPGYTLDEDLDWCKESLAALPLDTQDELIEEILMLVTDPNRNRQSFIRTVLSHVED